MFVNERGRILRNASRNSYKGFAKGFCGLGRLLASLNREEASNRVGTRLEWKLLPFLAVGTVENAKWISRLVWIEFTFSVARLYIFTRKELKAIFPYR